MGPLDLAWRALGAAALAGALASCASLPPLAEPQDPLSAQEHFDLGASYEAQGLKWEAAQQYEAAARMRPGDARVWIAIGNLDFDGGRLEDAERSFERALKISPGDCAASNNLAMVYLAQGGKTAQAEKLAQHALLQEGPLRPYVLDTLTDIYLREGRLADARAALEQAEKAAPPEKSFQERLARTRKALEAAERRP